MQANNLAQQAPEYDLARHVRGHEEARVPVPLMGYGFHPPKAEFWAALLAAQQGAQELGEDGDVEIKGKKAYSYAGYKAFIREGRRVLHAHGLVVFQLGALSAVDGKGRRSLLYGSFGVVHAATGQGMVLPFEWPVHATDKFPPAKATGASYSNVLRYFLRGLLLIPTGDGNADDPERLYDGGHRNGSAPQQAYQQAAQGFQQADVSYMQQQQAGQPLGTYMTPEQAWEAYYAQNPPTSVRLGVPDQAPAVTVPQGFAQPIAQAPAAVAPAQPQLPEQHPLAGPQPAAQPQGFNYDETRARHADAADQGEPTDNAGWCALLQQLGYSAGVAEDFAVQPLGEPVHAAVSESLRDQIAKAFPNDPEGARKLWEGTGYTPRLDLPKRDRPQPTGVQVLRYLRALKDQRKETHR